MGVRVRGCKDDQADEMTDPQGDTDGCIGKDEMKVLGLLEKEHSPLIYCPCKGELRNVGGICRQTHVLGSQSLEIRNHILVHAIDDGESFKGAFTCGLSVSA